MFTWIGLTERRAAPIATSAGGGLACSGDNMVDTLDRQRFVLARSMCLSKSFAPEPRCPRRLESRWRDTRCRPRLFAPVGANGRLRCNGHPAFPTPSVFRAKPFAKLGRNVPRESGGVIARIIAPTTVTL